MAETKSRKLEDAGGLELLRALGNMVVRGARKLPGQVAAKAQELVAAGGKRVDQAVCTAVRRHLEECARCRGHAKRLLAKTGKKKRASGKAKEPTAKRPA